MASHYAIEERSEAALRLERKELGIEQRATHRNCNARTSVGGVSSGDHGFFVQDLEAVPITAPTELRGWKSYFFVGDQVLALGSHIHGGGVHAYHDLSDALGGRQYEYPGQ